MTTNFGEFSSPSYTTIGDPYKDPEESKVHYSPGKRQLLTCPPRKGQISAAIGYGPRNFIGLAGSYIDSYKLDAQYRLQNTKKNLKPNGFSYSNPSKKSSAVGDYYGTFSGVDKQPTPTKKEIASAKTIKPRSKEDDDGTKHKRNMIANPSKKGTYGCTGTLLGGKEIPAMASDYGSQREYEKKLLEYHKEKLGDRKPFKYSGGHGGFIDGQEHCDVSKIYSNENAENNEKDSEKTTKKNEIIKTKDEEKDPKKWKPSNIGKTGKEGNFTPFPQQLAEPYDERIVMRAMLPLRRNPVAISNKDLTDSLKERKPFKPSGESKSKPTVGTCLLGINKHNV